MNATIPVNEAEKEKDRLEISQKAQAAFDRGRKLYSEKKYVEALEPYLYAFDNGHLVSGWGGVRLSFIPAEIARLGEHHPPALEALKERRDAREKLIFEGIQDYDIYSEWVALNAYLKDSEHCIKVTKKLSKNKILDQDLKELVVSRNLELFLESDETELVNACLNNRGQMILHTLADYETQQFAPYFKEDPEETIRTQNSTKRRLVYQTVNLYRLLLIRNDTDKAKALAERVLESLPDRDLFAGLISLERSHGKKSRSKKLFEKAEKRLSTDDMAWLEATLQTEESAEEKEPGSITKAVEKKKKSKKKKS